MSAPQQARHDAGIRLKASRAVHGSRGASIAFDATVAALSLDIKLSEYEGRGEEVFGRRRCSEDRG